MATNMVAPPTTWTPARRKSDGKRFFFVPGSKPGAVYMTAVDGCTCLAAQHSRTGDCKHQAAVRQYTVAAQPVRELRPRFSDLFPACIDCDDLADGADRRCSKCASDRAWEQRRESKRLAVAAGR